MARPFRSPPGMSAGMSARGVKLERGLADLCKGRHFTSRKVRPDKAQVAAGKETVIAATLRSRDRAPKQESHVCDLAKIARNASHEEKSRIFNSLHVVRAARTAYIEIR